jgi:hypothetical protein
VGISGQADFVVQLDVIEFDPQLKLRFLTNSKRLLIIFILGVLDHPTFVLTG